MRKNENGGGAWMHKGEEEEGEAEAEGREKESWKCGYMKGMGKDFKEDMEISQECLILQKGHVGEA